LILSRKKMFFCILQVFQAIINFFKKKAPVWNERLKEVAQSNENCRKLEQNGFGTHMEDNVKGIYVSNMKISANQNSNDNKTSKDNDICKGQNEDVNIYTNILIHDIPISKINATLSHHLTLLGMESLPVVSEYTRNIVSKHIYSNIVNLNAFSLHTVIKNGHFPRIKSIIYHHDFIQSNMAVQDDDILSNNYVIGFHATPFASKLIPGINFLLCQQRDDGFWGRGFYIARDIAQVLFYMIPYSKLISSGLEESDRGIIFMYAAHKKNLTYDVSPPGKTVGANIPDGIDYRLSDMGSEAVFSKSGVNKLFLVATIEISIQKINKDADVNALLNNIPDYFKGDRLETPRY
jgi:hypothetical protein